jgi:hypothetical protein
MLVGFQLGSASVGLYERKSGCTRENQNRTAQPQRARMRHQGPEFNHLVELLWPWWLSFFLFIAGLEAISGAHMNNVTPWSGADMIFADEP